MHNISQPSRDRMSPHRHVAGSQRPYAIAAIMHRARDLFMGYLSVCGSSAQVPGQAAAAALAAPLQPARVSRRALVEPGLRAREGQLAIEASSLTHDLQSRPRVAPAHLRPVGQSQNIFTIDKDLQNLAMDMAHGLPELGMADKQIVVYKRRLDDGIACVHGLVLSEMINSFVFVNPFAFLGSGPSEDARATDVAQQVYQCLQSIEEQLGAMLFVFSQLALSERDDMLQARLQFVRRTVRSALGVWEYPL